MTAEEQKKHDDLLAALDKKANDAMEVRSKAIEDKLKGTDDKVLELRQALDTANEALKAQGLKMTELQTTASSRPQDMSLRGQIQKWQDDNKDVLQRLKEGTAVELPALQLRAAITMTEAASLGSSAYLPRVEVAPGIVDLVRVQPTFWERLQKGRTRANPYVWVNKTNKQGNATFIGEGVLKPLASFELATESSLPKKVAERMKASTELLYDLEGMETFITQELRYEVETAANTAVLTGTLSSTSPAGVTTIASAYSLTTVKTTNPTNADAIRAAIAQLRSLNFNGTLTAYLNPIDLANMDLEKAQDSGVYMLPPFTTADGRVIAAVPVIEDNNIAVGFLLIGDMSKYRILMHQDFFVKWGWENDDFSKNLMTVIGEMRFHQFYSANHAGAWIYDELADIKAAITAA